MHHLARSTCLHNKVSCPADKEGRSIGILRRNNTGSNVTKLSSLAIFFQYLETGETVGDQTTNKDNFFLSILFGLFMALLIVKLKRVTRSRERERGSDTQQSDPGQELNPGPLQSLSTQDTRSNN